ncbi:MAG TPA: hypothetical protein ENF15_01110, partial [Candidatus Acetothermia bacterium]|nr:hypothetical protein [Candidatus Acetothermia bacterium]
VYPPPGGPLARSAAGRGPVGPGEAGGDGVGGGTAGAGGGGEAPGARGKPSLPPPGGGLVREPHRQETDYRGEL